MTDLVSIVTPAFNEEQNLPTFLRRAYAIVPALEERNAALEVVIVDDHSRDGTPAVVKRAIADYPSVKYVRLSRNCGTHAAISAGLKCCSGDCAVILAADLQDPPEAIPRLLDLRNEGNDVVWACRSGREGESFLTKILSKAYYRVMRRLAMPEMPAKGTDFLLIDRRVIDAYNAIPEKHTNCIALILWMGFRQASIQYERIARRTGRSKWTFAKKLKLFIDSVVSFSYVPIRFMSLLGFVMAAGGFLYALLVVVGRLVGWVSAGTGFAALMTVLLIGQGSILLMLGILGEYLWRTFDESRGRPRYIIEEILTSDKVLPRRQLEEKLP
jgi:glycosyltransferase involved in cell wall biosynthesis